MRWPDAAWWEHEIRRWRCMDPVPMTPNRIVRLAHLRGLFCVSWRYRDEPLMAVCQKLVKLGLLKRAKGAPGHSYFKPRRDVLS